MHRRVFLRACLVALCYSVPAWITAAAPAVATKPECIVERDVRVPMRDGVTLSANVFRPAGEGPHPVLVLRTPYGKPADVDPKFLAAGYIVVTQDVRGRYQSAGDYESFLRAKTHDAEDGADTVAWAAKLPGASGAVGTMGVSYNAFLQWRLAAEQPPALGAMAAFSIPARLTDLEGPGTMRPGRRLKWWYATIAPDLRKRGKFSTDPTSAKTAGELWDASEGDRLLNWLPWLTLPDQVADAETPHVQAWLCAPHVDPWQLDRAAARVQVPNLNVCGWYDHCNGSIDLHTAIHQQGGTKLARDKSRLIVGPWNHTGLGKRVQGKIDFGSAANVDLTKLQIRWFDHWLKHDENGADRDPSVRLFIMGTNVWRDETEWPLSRATPRTFYLTSGGGANTPSGDGRLVTDAPNTSGSDRYQYDPRDPVPTQWTPQLFTVPADQKPLAARRDILVYQTEPLAENLEVTGYPQVVLQAASTAADTDFFARLIDVAPDGTNRDVCQGMVRARYRHGLDKSELLTPGETTELAIRLRPTANVFLRGHRLRLDVTSSDFPNYDRDHNTAADPNADAELVTATQTIHHGGMTLSRIVLPCIAAEQRAGVKR